MSLDLDRCEIECAGESNPLRLARALLKQLPDVTKTIPIEEIALALDIQAIEERAFSGVEAVLFTDRAKTEGLIGVRTDARPSRRRYSIAHELGHVLNDRHEPTAGGSFACTPSDFTNPFGMARHVRKERQVNAFAIEVLTLRDQLAPILKPAAEVDNALRIAKRCGINREAALRRYVELHAETLAVAFARQGRLRYVTRSEAFPWVRIERDEPIGDAPMDVRPGDRVTSMDEVDAETCFDDGRRHRLFAQTLLQIDGFTATLLIYESTGDDGEDQSRFRCSGPSPVNPCAFPVSATLFPVPEYPFPFMLDQGNRP